MKKIVCLAFAALVVNCAFAQTKAEEHEWKITLHILDESGSPLARANAGVGFFTHSTPTRIDGVTDTNGIFVATHSDTPSDSAYPLSFRIEKQGYYFTWAQIDLGQGYDLAKWNQSVTLTLKKIGKPIAMYAKSINTHVPAIDKPIGYDLMIGDWIAPYGKGSTSDFLFTGHFEKLADGESDFTLTVSFPKLGDGIQEFLPTSADKSSGLLSPHEAPADGYQSKWVQTDNRKPGKPIETNRDENRDYIFRVRTVLDRDGNVVSTHYGKIYGDFMKFRYYLNPTPNSRNIEFDPKQNLIHGLDPLEQVTAP